MYFGTPLEKIFFYNIPTALLSLIPFFLITGPFFSDLAVSLISVIFLIYCILKKNFSFFKKNYFYFFLFFWIYLIFNSLTNNLNFDSLKISFFYIRYIIFVIAIINLLKFDNQFLKTFLNCLLLCFACLIIDGFYQYFMGENIVGIKKFSDGRVSSFFGDEFILGSYLSRLWPLLFATSIIFFDIKHIKFYLILLVFILAEVLIFLSGERTAFFYINLSAVFIIIFSNKLKKIRLLSLIASIILIIIISLFAPNAKERIIDYTVSQSNINNLDEGLYIFSKQHTHHYLSAHKMFLDNKLFGVGVKNFRNFCSDKKYIISELSCSTHPHNTYMQLLSEVGLIGFSFIFFLLLVFIYYCFKHLICITKKKYFFSDFEVCLLSGVLIVLWPLAPAGNIFNNWLNICYYLYLPFLIYSLEENSKKINFL